MNKQSIEGGCTCRELRYRVNRAPMFVHCCHCRWCQRETGSSYAVNALLEADAVTLVRGAAEIVDTPSNSGQVQRISRCPDCRIAVWSNYGGATDAVRFLRVGSLDNPDIYTPDIHIFTTSKQPWVTLGDRIPSVPEYYRRADHWPEASIERYKTALEK
ncbi:MAG: GFA family protein [Alphaproteobacteria bacterium]|nr:GFA family protein [Alphaproteobacteria bacterium]